MDQHTEPAGVNEVERGDLERDQPATTPVEPAQAGENGGHRNEVKLTLTIARYPWTSEGRPLPPWIN